MPEQIMTQNIEKQIKEALRDVPDFPKPGIVFKDITPILGNPELFSLTINSLVACIKPFEPDCIAGIEARGFLFGTPIAQAMNLPFIPIRKPGKLPWKTKEISYTLEYGKASIEMHEDALEYVKGKDRKVAVVDDLLATGGTTNAACQLIESVGGQIVVSAFVVELSFLTGRKALETIAPVCSLTKID